MIKQLLNLVIAKYCDLPVSRTSILFASTFSFRNHALEKGVLGLKSHGPNVPCWSKPMLKSVKFTEGIVNMLIE